MIWWHYFYVFIHVLIILMNHYAKDAKTKPYPINVIPLVYWAIIEFNLILTQFILQNMFDYLGWSTNTSDWVWTEGYILSLLKMLVGFVAVDVWFYITHRMLHQYMYSSVHFIHHQFSGWTFPSTTFYAHPVEHILSNVGLVLFSAHVTQMSAGLFWWWLHFIIWEGMRGHAGHMKLFQMNLQTKHSLHHMYRSVQFGAGGFMDDLCQTTFYYMKRKE